MRSEAFFNSFETDATDIISGNSPIGQLENFCWDFIQFVVWDIDTLQVGESWKFRHPNIYKNLLSKTEIPNHWIFPILDYFHFRWLRYPDKNSITHP